MASFNRVILMGNLTRDPELRYLPSNTAVCEFGLAINHRWKDRDGNQKEEVCFVDVTVFGRGGEIVNQYMAKGRAILIEGRLRLDTWTAQDGTKRSKHSVVAENFTFVGGRDGGGGAGGGSGGGEGAARGDEGGGYGAARDAAPRGAPAPRPAAARPGPPSGQEFEPPKPEDIPF
jgi:single-strand DNA-binding protein